MSFYVKQTLETINFHVLFYGKRKQFYFWALIINCTHFFTHLYTDAKNNNWIHVLYHFNCFFTRVYRHAWKCVFATRLAFILFYFFLLGSKRIKWLRAFIRSDFWYTNNANIMRHPPIGIKWRAVTWLKFSHANSRVYTTWVVSS